MSKVLKKAKHIHFVGIKGVGMAAMAVLAKEAGIHVTGSDCEERFVTDDIIERFKISWKAGFSPDNITGNPDLVVVTGAWGGLTNPEAQAAIKRRIKTVMQGEAVGLFMSGQFLGRQNLEGISIAGSHGKTTTSAMIATVLDGNHLNPSFIVGCGGIANLDGPGHFGKGKYFIAEADEYATCPEIDQTPKFLWQNPQILVITNIEYDHPDIFPSLREVNEAFSKFVQKLPNDGLLITGYDNINSRQLAAKKAGPVITFGQSPQSDWRLRKFAMGQGKSRFWVDHKGAYLDEFNLFVPGKFNALNGLAAIIVGMELGIKPQKIKSALSFFRGTKRRFEFIGQINGVRLYDDYAHHPTEIASTLSAAKNFFPGQKVTCIFQPHTYSRTKSLFSEFARSFSDAAEVIIVDIYSSAREKNDFGVDSKLLTQEIAKNHPNVHYLGTKTKVLAYLEGKAQDGDVIFTMGAGDIFLWHQEILKTLKRGEN